MPVETRANNIFLLRAIGFSRSGQLGSQRIGTGKRVMALDDGDTGAGRQPTTVFPQTGGLLLKLPQICYSQRQAKTPIAYESNIIAAEDNGPEGNVVAALSARQLDLDRHIPAQPMNNDLIAIFIDNSLDELVKHRLEGF